MKRFKEAAAFLLVSLLSSLAVFQDAMWGRSIAAPLDLAPALWKHYKHVDPNQGPIPRNHYIIDQLSYDLPLQYLMYHAWRQGEVPWWSPYTFSGRPLLADAHCNGTDPVRLVVYFTVPDFVLAYNWTLILHCIATGAAFFILLRGFGVRPWLAGACALAAQWAGGYVLYIGHPWVRATFIYYPLLWLAWRRALHAKRVSVASAILVAAIFYSGNLQSHSYLPVFAFAMGAGYAGRNSRKWWLFLKNTGPAIVLGALIAAPVLAPQLELFTRNIRAINPLGWHWLETGAVFAAVHPWAAGTFRTISLKSLQGGLSFHLALGGAVVILALFGWARRKTHLEERDLFATSGWLVLAYVLIVLTPLHTLLYVRAAGLGIMGLVVLAGLGGEALLRSHQPEIRWNRATWVLAALIAISTTVLAYWVYPRFQEKAVALLLARSETDGYGGATQELRKFQAANFANEVSLRNPEAALNLASLGLLAAAFAGSSRGGSFRLSCACFLSVIPLLLFAERFVVRSPVETWSRLLEGGPAQKPIVAQFGPSGARFKDEASQEFACIFPMEISALHRLHVTHGYAALQPQHGAALGRDFDSVGERYHWKGDSNRSVHIAAESLNRIRIVHPPGPKDVLVRGDTWYPGWTANGSSMSPAGPKGILGEIPVPAGQTETVCEYYPSGEKLGIACAIGAAIVALILAWASNRKTPHHS